MARMVFNPLGGIPQYQINTAEDLEQIEEIDRARWAATAAPVEQFFCDPAFLACVDVDDNHRILADEFRDARRWLWERLSGRDGVTQRSDTVRLGDIDPSHEEAGRLRRLAERVLANLGSTRRDAITLDQVRAARAAYFQTFPNGDGIVTSRQAAADADACTLIGDIIQSTSGTLDLSGDVGVDTATLATHIERCAALRAWRAQIVGEAYGAVFTLGEATPADAALITSLGPKVTQYIAQCALLDAEQLAGARLKTTAEELAALDVRDPAAIDRWLETAPLAAPTSAARFDLDGPVNPRFRAPLQHLAGIQERLGLPSPREFTLANWTAAAAAVQPWQAWQAAQPAGIDASLDDDRLSAAIDSEIPGRLRAMIDDDAAVAAELQEFHNLEKLVLYQRWLLDFANNFISFQHLFSTTERALFEMGTLVLDGRRLQLCTRVVDRAAHKAVAEKSGIFVAYATVTRKDADGADHTATLCAGLTAGTRGGIDTGKRGVFYDRNNLEWDAIITDVIVNPISVWEAAISPVVRLRAFITDKVSAFVGSKATDLEGQATARAAALAAAPPAPAPATAPAAAPAAGGGMQGLLIGGSLAFAAIGSSLAFVVQTLSTIDVLGMVKGLGILVIGVMSISALIGWIRLQQRDLSSLLEASGWALNGRMRMTTRLGPSFTIEPRLPKGSAVRLTIEQKRNSILILAFILLTLFAGYWLWTHPELLQTATPAPAVPPAPAPTPAAPT